MSRSSLFPNVESTDLVRFVRNDAAATLPHPQAMARKRSTPPSLQGHRWYLPEWASHFGKIQADAQRDLGWSKATASDLWNGKQRYTQDHIDEVSNWLSIEPFELLMLPREALALKAFREAAQLIASEAASAARKPPASSRNGQGKSSPK